MHSSALKQCQYLLLELPYVFLKRVSTTRLWELSDRNESEFYVAYSPRRYLPQQHNYLKPLLGRF